jgi:hypothetical protein
MKQKVLKRGWRVWFVLGVKMDVRQEGDAVKVV